MNGLIQAGASEPTVSKGGDDDCRPLRLVSSDETGASAPEQVRPRAGREQLTYPAIVVVAMMAGLAVRMLTLSGTGFPVGDGGMFYVMVQELLRHHFALPATTAYNAEHIPFAYPPLGFYLVAGLHALGGWSLLSLFRAVPIVASVLTIGAFGLLAKRMLPSQLAAAAATLAFATLPQAYQWEVFGGGITRSLGMLFAVLALWRAIGAFEGNRRDTMWTAVLVGLTVLSHVEWAWFVAYSLLFSAVWKPRRGAALARLAVIAAGAAVVALPWFALVLAKHGVSPFLSLLGGQGGALPWYNGLLNLAGFTLAPGVWFPLVAALGGLGFLVSVARRQWMLPAWLLLVLTIDGRVPLERAAIVLALLAGIAAEALVEARFLAGDLRLPKPKILGIAASCALLWAMCSAIAWDGRGTATVSPGARDAMSWVHEHTRVGATVAVVTSANWGLDFEEEWFPALTGRRSLTTVQGSEWLPGTFSRLYHQDQALQRCAFRGASCLEAWVGRYRVGPDYVYVSKAASLSLVADSAISDDDCCWSLRTALDHDPRFIRVYDGPGASIFQWKKEPSVHAAGL